MKNPKILVFIILCSCEQPGFESIPPSGLTATELLVANKWRYQSLLINGDTLNTIGEDFEPTDEVFDNRHVRHRSLRYRRDLTYEFRWDVLFNANMSLGKDQNYQPNDGFWLIINDTIIHNYGDINETRYKIEYVNEESFSRSYKRVIQNIGDQAKLQLELEVGDTAMYTEILQRDEQY